MKLSKRVWIVISGVQWLGIGVMLLVKGLRYLATLKGQPEMPAPLLQRLIAIAGSREQGALLVICLALLVGFIKGRTILAKAAERIAERIHLGDDLLTLGQVYDKRYYIILAGMIGLGFVLRALHLPLDIHGGIDVAIGSALIHGAMRYFRHLIIPQKST